MNFLQRLAVRFALWAAPPLQKLFDSAGGTLELVTYQHARLREQNDARTLQRRRLRDDLQEALAMFGAEPWLPHQQADLQIAREAGAQEPGVVTVLKERLAELELALEDRGWKRELAIGDTEFSRWGIQQIILISRLYFIKNPLIRRGVQVSSHYVFGRGFEVTVKENPKATEIVQTFLHDPRNRTEVSQTGLVMKEETLHTDGNLFWALFSDVKTGEVQIRAIDALQIEEIITDPDDDACPRYYHRRWLHKDFDPATGVTNYAPADEWYVDIDYEPTISTVNNKPLVKGKNGDYVRILHAKIGGLPAWHFGCPIVYAALDWARAYKFFLEDWAEITRALARFSWDVETQGGAPAIAGLKTTLATTLGNSGLQPESNPPPVTGSAFIRSPGTKVTPYRTAGATTEPEQGRRVMLMVASAFGLPETFFGDATAGSLATAKSLDRPTELKFLEAQERWRELLKRALRFVLKSSGAAPGGRLREANATSKEMTIDVKFPSILEHDIDTQVGAIVRSMTLDGKQVSGIDEKTGVGLLLQELGVEDVEAVLGIMYPRGSYEPDRTLNPPEPAPEPQIAKEAALTRAVASLKLAAKRMMAANGHGA